ncbi:MAG: alpha-1,2-fucosyltransferase [Actinomycetes bacterium]
MEGYFQHPRWFEPVLSEILDALRSSVASVVRPEERTFSEELGDFTVVSLRRGDYVRHGYALPVEYYESAVDALPNVDGPLVLLSDDGLVSSFAAPWFKAKGFDVVPESVLGARSRHRDLALLADASQVVMSNSTFCWWGTVLGDDCDERKDHERFVVAPRDWITRFPMSPVLIRNRWLAL